MAEYGSGISFAQSCAYDKERIKHALSGSLICGEDENGFCYAPADWDDCKNFILSAYDEAVFQAIKAMRSGRVLEKLINEHAPELRDKLFRLYVKEVLEEELRERKNSEYRFECDSEN